MSIYLVLLSAEHGECFLPVERLRSAVNDEVEAVIQHTELIKESH